MTDTRQTYQGSCHCRRVTFELRANLDHVVDCNCSSCRSKGALWHAASGETFRILTGEADLVLYEFNTKAAGPRSLCPPPPFRKRLGD